MRLGAKARIINEAGLFDLGTRKGDLSSKGEMYISLGKEEKVVRSSTVTHSSQSIFLLERSSKVGLVCGLQKLA